MMTRQIPLVVMSTLLVGAAMSDLVRRKVPNAITIPLLVSGLLAQLEAGGLRAAGDAALAVALAGFVLFVGWRSRLLGGGDVKMGSAAAAWVGCHGVIAFLLATAIAGGFVSIASYALSGRDARQRVHATFAAAALGLAPTVSTASRRVPYSLAIVAGTVTALLWRA